MLRLVEILVVLAVLSRVTVQLPVSFKGSGDYIKDFLLILVSPRFVFVVGNIIVVVLFVKSGHLTGLEGKGSSKSSDLYEQFVEMSSKSAVEKTEENRGKQSEDKTEENRGKQSEEKSEAIVKKQDRSSSDSTMVVRNYERSKSEKLTRSRSITKELRRSKKEKKDEFPEDDLSSEEFKSTIEAFIERQKRFRRDEENSVFV
ncbi:hypothetical protein LINPERPRIM_LOCUS9128 [Linum perenne]